jgi:hypothetical protein
MAEKRYSAKDQEKMVKDKMQEVTARRIADAQTIYSVHPQGKVAALDYMLKNPTAVRDQSQEQIQSHRETIAKRRRS